MHNTKTKNVKILKKEEYVYKVCKIRMGRGTMADFTYAIIMTKTCITGVHGIGIENYNRIQNAFNHVDFMIHIHPSMVDKFTFMVKCIITDPQKVNIN